jgi:hypothetical protein
VLGETSRRAEALKEMFVRAATGESFRAFDISVHQIGFATTFPNFS